MDVKLVNLTKEFMGKTKKELTLKGIVKKEQAPNVVAVDHINVDIPSGKLVGLLGPSGCGKSTTLYMIAGLHTPTEGQIYFGEQDITTLAPEKRGIGLVFQNYALYPHMTVEQNILFPLENQKVEKTVAKERALEAAKLVQIDNLMDRKPNELSGGQQQRVAIARALVKAPNVLLLDEPLSNLDARLRLQTREEIKRIQRETGVTTVFVTHDQEEAMSISDEIVVMKLGVEQQKGAPQEVYNNPVNKFVAKFLGTPPINFFNGRIENKELYIGDEKIGDSALEDQDVTIGIRPEGFEVVEDGSLTIEIAQIEYIGRDKSIVGKNSNSENPTFRFIIDADIPNIEVGKIIKANIKTNKCYVFDKVTESRIQ